MHTGENPFQFIVPLLKYLPVLLIVTALVVFIVIVIRRLIKDTPKDYAAGITVEASVFSKRQRKKRDPNTLPYDKEYAYAATSFYYITFETNDCRRIELSVNSETYKRLTEGDTGTLTYQGSQYIDFIQGSFA